MARLTLGNSVRGRRAELGLNVERGREVRALILPINATIANTLLNKCPQGSTTLSGLLIA